MEFINYHEMKREAYIEAIRQLEEEYSGDKSILRRLEQYKIKHLNNN